MLQWVSNLDHTWKGKSIAWYTASLSTSPVFQGAMEKYLSGPWYIYEYIQYIYTKFFSRLLAARAPPYYHVGPSLAQWKELLPATLRLDVWVLHRRVEKGDLVMGGVCHTRKSILLVSYSTLLLFLFFCGLFSTWLTYAYNSR